MEKDSVMLSGQSDYRDKKPEFETSPFWPQRLMEVFFRPSTFFSSQLALGKTPYMILVTWCYGIAQAMEQVDKNILRAEMGRSRPGWEAISPFILDSWPSYWGFVIALGAISAVFLWTLGGWWYRMRLKWSGAVNPDAKLARLVYIYSSFVWAGPVVLLGFLQTLVFSSYREAWMADEIWSSAILIFPFWSPVNLSHGVLT